MLITVGYKKEMQTKNMTKLLDKLFKIKPSCNGGYSKDCFEEEKRMQETFPLFKKQILFLQNYNCLSRLENSFNYKTINSFLR